MSDRSINEAINKMVGTHKVDQVSYCNAEVISVNIQARTCDCIVIDGQTEYDLPNVRLMAVIDDGILFEPVIGSTVKVIFSRLVEPFVCQYSELENITIDAVTTIKFNDGSFGGLLKIKETVDKLNALEKDLNNLKNAFNSWVIVPSDGGLALKTITSAWSGQSLTKTKINDLENKKVKHGN